VKALTIRNVDSQLAEALRREVRRRGTSLNQTVLDLLRATLMVGGQSRQNGLESLAGSWSQQEHDEFSKATESFDQIDDELWR
jgi:plasmid stability protein